MTSELFTSDMKPIRLSTRIGKGAEGEVYALDGVSDQVVKLYTVADLQSREAKINKMIADKLAQTAPLIAFPIALVRNKSGKFAGFTMAKVSGHQPLHELYAPGVRKAAFPRADYRFLVRAAANIARAIGAAHNAECVIGDINHSGLLISTQATATLIDADSFQIIEGAIRHACKVGTPEYTPPELQGKSLDGVLRTRNHDAFGLAIVIFQLLWMGRHPFSGRYSSGEIPMEKAITEFRFAYSSRSVGMQPPPATPTLKDFPPAIAAAFEQAFGPQGCVERPTAKHWISLLKELEDALQKCTNNSLHHYAPQASECPWCRMERMFGVPLFVPVLPDFTNAAGFAAMSGNIAVIWNAIATIPRPVDSQIAPTVSAGALNPSSQAEAAKSSRYNPKFIGGGLLLAAALMFAVPQAIVFAVIAGIAGLYFLNKDPEISQDFVRRYREFELRRLQAEDGWKARTGSRDFDVLRDNLTRLKAEFDGLADEEKQRIQEYTTNRRSVQMRVFLEGFQIRRTKIQNVGPAKLAMLTSYGIETAADVSSSAVQNVPGFGPVNSRPLIEWRANLERRFVYNGSPTPADTAAVKRVKSEIANKAVKIREELATGPDRLRKLSAAIKQMQNSVDPVLQQATYQAAQALTDLKFLGLEVPVVTLPTKAGGAFKNSVQPGNVASTPQQTAGSQNQSCPRCGSRMITRTARRGRNAGNRFWGCTLYPICTGTRSIP
jgi:DNA-binding helix-hairpin-helix protein with protein kinase domain